MGRKFSKEKRKKKWLGYKQRGIDLVYLQWLSNLHHLQIKRTHTGGIYTYGRCFPGLLYPLWLVFTLSPRLERKLCWPLIHYNNKERGRCSCSTQRAFVVASGSNTRSSPESWSPAPGCIEDSNLYPKSAQSLTTNLNSQRLGHIGKAHFLGPVSFVWTSTDNPSPRFWLNLPHSCVITSICLDHY